MKAWFTRHLLKGWNKKKVITMTSTLVLAAAVALCVFVLAQVLTRGYVTIAGRSVFRVVTGSMEPTIPTGSLLVSRTTEIETLEEGDIICFRSQDPTQQGRIITHRVVGVYQDSDGGVLLETRGDANLAADGYFVTSAQLIGKVTWYSKEGNPLAVALSVLTNKIGFLACIVFPVLLVAGFILQACVKNIHKEMDDLLREMNRREAEEQEQLLIQALYTPEQYAEMVERIRKEISEELRSNAQQQNSEN